MTDREPTEARNLDIYGGGELAWGTVRDALTAERRALSRGQWRQDGN